MLFHQRTTGTAETPQGAAGLLSGVYGQRTHPKLSSVCWHVCSRQSCTAPCRSRTQRTQTALDR
eukprot:718219-Pyramimonas_sp.AAC.1